MAGKVPVWLLSMDNGFILILGLVSVTLLGKNELSFNEEVYGGTLLRKWAAVLQ